MKTESAKKVKLSKWIDKTYPVIMRKTMIIRFNPKIITLFLLLFITASAFCQAILPKLVSDGVVLQRDAEVKIWGWASKGEKVSIHFMGISYHAMANQDGEWEVMLANLKAGGPYEMQIDASNSITINDILVGDVWVCSGQSNMGLSLGMLRHIYKNEIEQMDNPFIRQFFTYPGTNFKEREKDFRFGRWQDADSNSIRGLTAVGYFFAKKLYEEYRVPIGLINSSMGGSSAEAWISEESIKAFPIYYEQLQRFKEEGYIDRIKQQDDQRVSIWNRLLKQNDEGFKSTQKTWFDPKFNASDWETTHVPGYWANTKLGNVNGVVWFRKKIDVPQDMVGKPALIKLGRIVDCDTVFINGKFIGSTGSQYASRVYKISDDILKEGKNTIVIRVINYIRKGGFVPGKEYELAGGNNKINLEGEWKYKLGSSAEPLEDRLFLGKIPSGLFNAGIAPILNYRIKGVLWYQGESNTSRAFEHYDLFKLLIKDWRHNWQQGNFPFLYVQLPNFVEVNIERTRYDWAIFRESQLKALVIPNTGMAVTIDVGEYNDIHPKLKKPVGERLALAVRKVAYGEKDIVYSGPIYKSMKIEGNKIILKFSQVGSGLRAKNGNKLNCFEICGINNEYFPAEAEINNDKIIVWSDKVAAPVAVRYAWANNPEGANLYNKEGLPATPFRTSELY
jgi:sialate O-acetylesterase